MKKLYSFITITILGYLGCADLLYEEKPPVILWGKSYSIETTFILTLNNKELSGPIPSENWESYQPYFFRFARQSAYGTHSS